MLCPPEIPQCMGECRTTWISPVRSESMTPGKTMILLVVKLLRPNISPTVLSGSRPYIPVDILIGIEEGTSSQSIQEGRSSLALPLVAWRREPMVGGLIWNEAGFCLLEGWLPSFLPFPGTGKELTDFVSFRTALTSPMIATLTARARPRRAFFRRFYFLLFLGTIFP